MIAAAQEIIWTASATENSGLLLSQQSGTLLAQGGAKTSQALSVTVPSDAAHGSYLITFKLKTVDGTPLPDVVVTVFTPHP